MTLRWLLNGLAVLSFAGAFEDRGPHRRWSNVSSNGYDYVDPLIGTFNGGTPITTMKSNSKAESCRPRFCRSNAAFR
jgi:hypothetical protein